MEKKQLKMPHLFWIMLGLLLFASLLTYIVPAGKFAIDEKGKIIGSQFSYLGSQSPVSPWGMLMFIMKGLVDSGMIIWVVLISGAMTSIVMATGAIDELLGWAIYKLKDKNQSILISIMFILMVYLGGFGGTDALIAVVPIGVIFSKKLKLDPICAMGVTTYATLIGFGTGPVKQSPSQMLMGVRVYGAFFTMFLSMNFFMLVGLFFLINYINKIKKNPAHSLMYNDGWNPNDLSKIDEIKKVPLSIRSIIIILIFLGQYILIVAYPFFAKDSKQLYPFMLAINLIVSIIAGFLAKFSFKKLAEEFSKGLSSIVFVGFVIGLAKVMSLVLTNGQVLDTIVYILTKPLMDLPRTFASIGMTAVISLINLIIPSASSKAAILIPILKPIVEALNMPPELGIQAFQYGDGFSNLISPALGWTVGSCAMAGVPFPKWLKWVFPKVIVFILLSFLCMFILTSTGWTAF
ncbi:MAG: AbgT family transporter [Fusobacterium sp.]|uniref:AbgT family transporter n=1 Tax=Fusobacterium sp. TaxID=68766 RepID=UPI0026DAFC26|nr:AbgT family transporter [Fusobacterium sp.]MDO4690400.1 AbgT family transporter [Fusobacterium sp.]